jgi:hypothetical protein
LFKTTLHITDSRMLELINLLKQNGLVKYKYESFERIGINRQNIRNIQLGTQYFTVTHIENACKYFNVNANWIYGFETNVFRKNSS